jgi:4'-phosphopantetheinyl transferase EntD
MDDHVDAALTSLFPPDVATATATPEMADAALFPEEEAWVSAQAPRRRREFSSGRGCARAALERLGMGRMAIPVGPDRAPRWPAGVVGSLTHCRGFCGAAVALGERIVGLGLDAEPVSALPEKVAVRVCTPWELAWIGAQSEGLPWALVFFSAKESVYKAWYPRTGCQLLFHDVELVVDARERSFAPRLRRAVSSAGDAEPSIAGRFVVGAHHVVTSATWSRRGMLRPHRSTAADA